MAIVGTIDSFTHNAIDAVSNSFSNFFTSTTFSRATGPIGPVWPARPACDVLQTDAVYDGIPLLSKLPLKSASFSVLLAANFLHSWLHHLVRATVKLALGSHCPVAHETLTLSTIVIVQAEQNLLTATICRVFATTKAIWCHCWNGLINHNCAVFGPFRDLNNFISDQVWSKELSKSRWFLQLRTINGSISSKLYLNRQWQGLRLAKVKIHALCFSVFGNFSKSESSYAWSRAWCTWWWRPRGCS